MYHPQRNHHSTYLVSSLICCVVTTVGVEVVGLVLLLEQQPRAGIFVIVSGITVGQILINIFYLWSVGMREEQWTADWRSELMHRAFPLFCLLVDLLAIATLWIISARTRTRPSLDVSAVIIGYCYDY